MEVSESDPPLLKALHRGGAPCLQLCLWCWAGLQQIPKSWFLSTQLIDGIGHKATAGTAGGRRQALFPEPFLM